jgi:hypothetical protein
MINIYETATNKTVVSWNSNTELHNKIKNKKRGLEPTFSVIFVMSEGLKFCVLKISYCNNVTVQFFGES